MQLVTSKKGSQTAAAYYAKVKAIGDELVAAGRPVPDEELVTFILAGLDFDYNPVVSSVLARATPISLSDLYAQLLAYDTRLQMLQENYNAGQNSSVNAASRGRGGFRGRGRGGGTGRGQGGRGNANSPLPPKGGAPASSKPICQVCKKKGHEADVCWHRFEEDFQPYTKSAGAATTNYGYDTNWYADSGATDHITAELEKLTVRDKYKGADQVHTASGSGMRISNIGHAILHTPNKNLHLQNVLHVPSANKNLVSIHRLTSDNNTYVEFHPHHFFIKDRATKKTIHQGRCEGGLYPLRPQEVGAHHHKQACGVSRPSTWIWHSRLGHASFPVVERVIRNNLLPRSTSHHVESVCDSCQKAKSHQFPYSSSENKSCAPLDLIHSDVWGPAPISVGNYTYYVSFIDDYSRYTWIYLLKHKSKVFHVFKNFQSHVERKYTRKIIRMQTDWGGEYERLNSFFNQLGIAHRVSCPHTHQQNGRAERKHRHIVEVGLSLLAQASMPLEF